MKYKCIIFDCDGVLVDSEPIANRIIIEMANSLGLKIELNYVLENYEGKSLKSCFDDIESKIKTQLPTDFEYEYRKRTFEAFKTELKPIVGIHDLLDKLPIHYCVASNGPIEKIELNLTTVKLIDKFRGSIYSAYEIGSWKPNSAIYQYAAKQMGYKVNECVVIDDSPSGIQAGISGGFDTYQFTNGRDNIPLNGAINTFSHMSELYELIE